MFTRIFCFDAGISSLRNYNYRSYRGCSLALITIQWLTSQIDIRCLLGLPLGKNDYVA